MKEQQQFIQNENLNGELNSKERPMVDRWVTICLPALRMRKRLVDEITAGVIPLEGDVPDFLLPIMQRWAKEGPVILTSYGHPEELEMYKFMGHLNLALFLEKTREQGFSIPKDKIMENWYETVAFNRTVTEPLNVGETFSRDKLKADPLGLTGHRLGSETIDCDKQAAILEQVDIEGISKTVVDLLTNELDDELKLSMFSLTRRERHEMRQTTIKNIIVQRLSVIIGLANSSLSEIRVRNKPTINDFLIEFEKKLAGFILDDQVKYGSFRKIGYFTGIEGVLSSGNENYLGLVIDTLHLIIKAKGVKVLKDLVDSTGEGLFLGVFDDKEMLLTVDKETARFILMNKKTYVAEQIIEDPELIDFVKTKRFFPLAKSETLALVASGMTFHMGSEYGNRAKALAVLNINEERYPQLYAYLTKLRIGQDLEQGNNLFAVNGGKAIPAVLAFLLLGRDFLRSKMLERVGVESRPESLTDKELRKLAAKSLVSNAKKLQEKRGLDQNRYGGYLWS